MVEPRRPRRRLGYYFGATLFSTVVSAAVMGLLTSPVTLIYILAGDPHFQTVSAAALLGWGLMLGQKMVFSGFAPEESNGPDFGWIIETAVTILTVAYYNVVTFIAVLVGSAIAMAGVGPGGLLFALGYPMYEMWTVERGFPFSVAGVVVAILATFLVTAEFARKLSQSQIYTPLRFLRGGRSV